jgi:hypothetical protein
VSPGNIAREPSSSLPTRGSVMKIPLENREFELAAIVPAEISDKLMGLLLGSQT